LESALHVVAQPVANHKACCSNVAW
jgi:hypothetical protein